MRVVGIFETTGLLQLRLPAVWGHWTTNCHCNSLSEWCVFLRPQGCSNKGWITNCHCDSLSEKSNWGCPLFEGIGLPIFTVLLFQSGWYFWDHSVVPTEAARRFRALDYQLSLNFSCRVVGIFEITAHHLTLDYQISFCEKKYIIFYFCTCWVRLTKTFLLKVTVV